MVGASQVSDEVWKRLREAGLRVTPLRRRLVSIFASSEKWFTPEELSEAARKAGLRPGRATVYRLIGALMSAGLSKSFPQDDRPLRYVFCKPGHHHHLICLDCGRVVDVMNCRVKAPDASFVVSEHVVDFFGHCAVCQESRA
jgi:Fur family transcriptional regulator, ferric uptake regulator